ncbi:hypothetical protein BOTBODRAFT_244611 [Botryobasidium botryosum FD-172 SS1]|uniref:Uncharacterized protein n=1 Tax=Botryobasidium botryosum (strain FD-172 SS1) TaxID=930990 RepID=A0A067LU67_BOTB1|nr:hypothetical protein BOTBODRAFT_244611 [Botryobasidium botryosum FD-172 SS1]
MSSTHFGLSVLQSLPLCSLHPSPRRPYSPHILFQHSSLLAMMSGSQRAPAHVLFFRLSPVSRSRSLVVTSHFDTLCIAHTSAPVDSCGGLPAIAVLYGLEPCATCWISHHDAPHRLLTSLHFPIHAAQTRTSPPRIYTVIPHATTSLDIFKLGFDIEIHYLTHFSSTRTHLTPTHPTHYTRCP